MKGVNVITKEKSVKETSNKAAAKKNVVAKTVETEKEAMKQIKEVQLTLVKPEINEEKTEDKKTVTKKTVEKKESVKQMKEIKEEVYVQFANQEVLMSSILEKVKAGYAAEGNKAEDIKNIRVYVKPEENMVYYVVNDDYASGVRLF